MYFFIILILLLFVTKLSLATLSGDEFFEMAENAAENEDDYLDIALYYWNSMLLSPGMIIIVEHKSY